MKKQLKILIVLVIVALILGGLVLATSSYNVNAITDGISAIGKVTWSEESRKQIDAVDDRIATLDPDLHLEEKVQNLDELKNAKVKYVEQAIIRLYKSIRDKQDEETIRQYLADAEEAFSHYLTDADIPLIHNYKDLTDAREKYGNPEGAAQDNSKPNNQQPAGPIELC